MTPRERYIRLVLRGMTVLTPRERMILQMRFGINSDAQTHTLESVGKEFGVTRERIRGLEAQAISKILAYINLELELPQKKRPIDSSP